MKFKIGNLVCTHPAAHGRYDLGTGLILSITTNRYDWFNVYWFKLKEIHKEHISWIE